jgi:hypothetical protein
MDNVTVATNMTSVLVGCKLGAVAFSDNSDSFTVVASGENNSFRFFEDFTSYFNTNFGSGTSQTCQIGVTIGGIATVNLTAKLLITYDYDDASQQTRVKTVRIPLESGLGALTATLAEIGTNQVPNLDTLLPESSKTYRCVWFEIEGNNCCNGTTDFYLGMALDAEGEVQSGVMEAGLNSARNFKLTWVRNDMTTNATHAFKMRVTSLTGGDCYHLAVVLCVTYEYDHTNSTSIMNSLVLPFSSTRAGALASGDKVMEWYKFFIDETSPSLVQSGVLLNYIQQTGYSTIIACGSQSTRTYTNADRMFCGGLNLSHRIDSGSGGGAGITLARGENTFTFNAYNGTGPSYPIGALCGLLFLNYTSSKHASGADVHNHSVFYGLTMKGSVGTVVSATVQPQIPESNYLVNWVGAVAVLNVHTTNRSVCPTMVICAERMSGEGPAAGWVDLLGGHAIANDNEAGPVSFAAQCGWAFKCHPGDPDTEKMDIETSRLWARHSIEADASTGLWVTYHAITYSVSGTISGSGGGTVNLYLHRKSTGELLATTSRVGNGAYSFTWYDNVEDVYVVAYEDATHAGRSADGDAS